MSMRGVNGAIFLVIGMLLFPRTASSATPPDAGSFEYLIHDGRVSLWANEADLADVLLTVAPELGIHFAPDAIPDRRVSCRYFNITIDRLMDRLGISGAIVIDRGHAPARIVGASFPEVTTSLASPPSAWSPEVRRLISDLRDDDVRWNGENAIWELVQLGTGAMSALEYTLGSDDYQARQFAAEALSSMRDHYEPSDAFFRVLVEGLADDEYPMDNTPHGTNEVRFTCVFNARTGYTLLTENPEYVEPAEPHLARALFSDDAQQRFLAALIYGEAGDTRHIARVAQILIPHLEDNFISSDAGCAAYALYQIGDAVRPYIEPVTRSEDEQQAALARLILYHLEHPDSDESVKMLPDDFSMSIYDDPVASWQGLTFWGWMTENFP